MSKDSIHVVMVPWLAFGHLNPFYQLSVALAKQGVHVSFLCTPRNTKKLPKLPPNLAPLVNLVEFPLPSLGLLPENAEATVDIPADQILHLKEAYDLLQEPAKHFITDNKPDWVIVDAASSWIVEIVQELDIPLILFSVFSASTRVFFGPPKQRTSSPPEDNVVQKESKPLSELLTAPPPWVDFPSMVCYRKHEAVQIIDEYHAKDATRETIMQYAARVEDACKAVALRTCPEIESDYLETHKKIFNKRVMIPIGMLPPEVNERDLSNQPTWQKISKWLDTQKPKSVVFVGFGSACKLSKNQIYEIANGIQLSGLPFLWIFQKPSWTLSDDVDAYLPSGFCKGRGLVHIGWAPQEEILAHSSIGGSLFHAGWGSAIETLQYGHALVVLPFIYDQGLNARLLVEKGFAIEVKRNEDDGSFSGNDIAMSLRQAMVLEEGEELRARARNVAAIFGDRKLHESYVRNFVEYMKSN